MTYLSKEQIEIQKVMIELPKQAIVMVSFFATASALVLRQGSSNHGVGYFLGSVFSFDAATTQKTDEFLLIACKLVFLIAIWQSVDVMYKCYNFIAMIARNVTESSQEPSPDAIFEKQVSTLRNDLYPKLKSSLDNTVVFWAYILAVYVIAL